MDAGGGRVALGGPHRPPGRGSVEAVAPGAQGRWRREADDGRGDAAAFAVYPAAVVGLQVEAGSAARDREQLHVRTTN